MTAIEIAKQIVETKGALLVRQRKATQNGRRVIVAGEYDSKPYFDHGNRRGWVLFDLFTASAVVQVHDALNETNRAKFAALPLLRMVDVTWKLVSPKGARP